MMAQSCFRLPARTSPHEEWDCYLWLRWAAGIPELEPVFDFLSIRSFLMLLCTLSKEYQLSGYSKRCICLMQRKFTEGDVKLWLQEMMARIAGNTPHVEKDSRISLSLESLHSLPFLPSLTPQGRHKTRGRKHQCGQSVLHPGNINMEEWQISSTSAHFAYLRFFLFLIYFLCFIKALEKVILNVTGEKILIWHRSGQSKLNFCLKLADRTVPC